MQVGGSVKYDCEVARRPRAPRLRATQTCPGVHHSAFTVQFGYRYATTWPINIMFSLPDSYTAYLYPAWLFRV